MKMLHTVIPPFLLLGLLVLSGLVLRSSSHSSFLDAILGEPTRPPRRGRTFVAGSSCTLYLPDDFAQLPSPSARADGHRTLGVFEGSDGLGHRARITVLERDCEITDPDMILSAYESRFGGFRCIVRGGGRWLAAGNDDFVCLWRLNGRTLCRIEIRALSRCAARSPQLREMLRCVTASLQEADVPAAQDAEPLVQDAEACAETPVSFLSSGFERLVRIAMNKPAGEPFYKSELADVRYLYIGPRRVALADWMAQTALGEDEDVLTCFSLKDLSHFTGLETLCVDAVGLEDLDALKALPLETLSLSMCDLTDENCAPLGEMTNLRSLHLFCNDLTTIDFITGLTSLEDLSLSFNPIHCADPLAALTKLRSLDLSGTFITSLESLKDMHELESLDASLIRGDEAFSLLSLAPLAGLKNLHELSLFFSDVTDVESVAHVECITGLEE